MIPTAQRAAWATVVLLLLAGAAAVGVALHLHGAAAAARQQAEQAWRDAQARLERLPARIAQARPLRGQLAELDRRGFVGAARRLDWVSALARSQRALALESIAWRLEPGRPTALTGLGATRMHLDLGPMTPDGLAAFLQHLDGLGQGLFTVAQCDWTLEPLPQRMQCSLDWWNFQGSGDSP